MNTKAKRTAGSESHLITSLFGFESEEAQNMNSLEQESKWRVATQHTVDSTTALVSEHPPFTAKLLNRSSGRAMVKDFIRIAHSKTPGPVALNWLDQYGLLVEGDKVLLHDVIETAKGISWLNDMVDSWLSDSDFLQQQLRLEDGSTNLELSYSDEYLAHLMRQLNLPRFTWDGVKFVDWHTKLSDSIKKGVANRTKWFDSFPNGSELSKKLDAEMNKQFYLWSFSDKNGARLWLKNDFTETDLAYGNPTPSTLRQVSLDRQVLSGPLGENEIKKTIRILGALFFGQFFQKAFENIRLTVGIEAEPVEKIYELEWQRPIGFALRQKLVVSNPLDLMYLSLFQKLTEHQQARKCVVCSKVFFPTRADNEVCSRACISKRHRATKRGGKSR